jgi:hypothetical protein
MMRLSAEHGEDSMVPLLGGLRFRLGDPGTRYCCGWFDYTGAEPQHRPCAGRLAVTGGWQCARCRVCEGFVPVHQAHRSSSRLPENVRRYMACPHWLYLSIFVDGSIKVGTAAQVRLRSRLTEQGPVAGRYLARAENGVDVRKAEAEVSARLGFKQAVSSSRKLRALGGRIDIPALNRDLTGAAAVAEPLLRELADTSGWITPLVPELHWEMPAIARALVEAAPLVRYPSDLAAGDHSLFITAASGPLAMFTVRHRPEASVYLADLSALRGSLLTFGEFSSDIGEVQASLF